MRKHYARPLPDEGPYLIYSIRYSPSSGGDCTWWKPNRCGYTTDVDKAGRYSAQEATLITDNNQSDTARAIPLSDVDPFASRCVRFSVVEGGQLNV